MPQQPNVIFIVADDLGFADLGCYGGRVAVSPVLDRMAAEGIRFTHGYANSPVCSPTRFALMTGRWQYRLRGEPVEHRRDRHAAAVAAEVGEAEIVGDDEDEVRSRHSSAWKFTARMMRPQRSVSSRISFSS